MLRRLLALLGLAAGALAGLLAYRGRLGGGTRLDVHFDDGSLVSYGSGSRAAQQLLMYARDALSVVRS